MSNHEDNFKQEMEQYLGEFQDAYEMEPNLELWTNLVDEETEEMLKENMDVLYVTAGALVTLRRMELQDPDSVSEHQIPLLEMSLDVQLHGAINRYGLDLVAKAFRTVHASNMSKLGEDGKPIRREDGKILKGPNYLEPDLRPLMDEEIQKELMKMQNQQGI